MIVSISASFTTDFVFIIFAGPCNIPLESPLFFFLNESLLMPFPFPPSLSPFLLPELLASLSTTITPLVPPMSALFPPIPIPIIPLNKFALIAFIAAAVAFVIDAIGFSLITSNILSNSSITNNRLCVGIYRPLI